MPTTCQRLVAALERVEAAIAAHRPADISRPRRRPCRRQKRARRESAARNRRPAAAGAAARAPRRRRSAQPLAGAAHRRPRPAARSGARPAPAPAAGGGGTGSICRRRRRRLPARPAAAARPHDRGRRGRMPLEADPHRMVRHHLAPRRPAARAGREQRRDAGLRAALGARAPPPPAASTARDDGPRRPRAARGCARQRRQDQSRSDERSSDRPVQFRVEQDRIPSPGEKCPRSADPCESDRDDRPPVAVAPQRIEPSVATQTAAMIACFDEGEVAGDSRRGEASAARIGEVAAQGVAGSQAASVRHRNGAPRGGSPRMIVPAAAAETRSTVPDPAAARHLSGRPERHGRPQSLVGFSWAARACAARLESPADCSARATRSRAKAVDDLRRTRRPSVCDSTQIGVRSRVSAA